MLERWAMLERWGFAFVTFGVMAVLTGLWLVQLRRARDERGERRLSVRVVGATCVVLYVVIVLEVAVGLFVVKSDGYGITRAGYRWFQTHWWPINSLGYRDVEPTPPEEGERVLLVVGDSIAAGHGIERLEDRFASALARGLGPEWRVPVAAMCGWNMGEEITALEAWPHRFERVLVTHTLTDIETAANDVGLRRPEPSILPPPALVRPIIDHSHLFNWVYWRYLRRDFGTRYSDFLGALHANPEVWAAHEERLRALIAVARARGAEIRFLLWPDLTRIEECAAPMARIAQFLAAEGVLALDLTERLRGRDPRDSINNELDEHPNEAMQAEAAGWVLEWLRQ
jgi:hypothetical protein